ncbi:hypothetical protein QJQ45_023940 [Haematococcus lacustris]|nr:hypothetical protein QJQ45_023940 [Haematococcus lacustris]
MRQAPQPDVARLIAAVENGSNSFANSFEKMVKYKLTSTSDTTHSLLDATRTRKAIFTSSNPIYAKLLTKAKEAYKSPAAPTIPGCRARDTRYNNYTTQEFEDAIAAVERAKVNTAVLAPYTFLYDTKTVVLKDLTAAFKEDILRKVDAVLSSMGCEEYTLNEVPKLGGMDTMELVVEATHEDEEVRRAAMLGLVGAAISTGGLLSMLPCTQPLSSTSSTTTQARPLLFFPKTPSPTMAFTLKMSSNAYCSDPAANAVLTNRAVGPAATSLLKSLGYLRMKMAQDAQLLSHPLYLLACSVHAAADVPNRNMTKVEFTDHDTCTAIQSAGELTVSGSKVRFTLTQPQFSRVSGLNTKHALILSTASDIGMDGLASTVKGLAEAYLAIFGVDLSLNATFQAGTNATPPLKGTAVTASNVANYTATPNHVSLASSSSSAIISAVGLGSRAKTNLYPGGGPQRAATVYTVADMSSKGTPIQDCSKKAITIMGHDESYTGSAAAVGTDSMQPLSRKAEMHKAACFAMAEAYHLTHADQRRAKDFLDSSQHLLVEDKDQGHEANRRMMAITSSLDKLVAQCLPLVKAMLEAAATTTDSARAAATRKVLDIYTVMVDIIGNPTPGLRRDPPQRPVTMATTSRPPMGAPRSSTFLPGRAQSAAASLPPRAAGTGGRRTSDERQSPPKQPLKRHNSTSSFQHLYDEMDGAESMDLPSA